MGLKISDMINCGLCLSYRNGECTNNSVDIQKHFQSEGVTYALQCRDFTNSKIPLKNQMSNRRALGFILAGISEFLVESGKTGRQFIYKVEKKNNQDNTIYWVYIKDNSGYLRYMGTMYLESSTDTFCFARGKKGTTSRDSVEVKSLLYIINNLRANKEINVRIYNFNKCGSCGNQLTSDEEIERGICDKCNKSWRRFY